MAIGLVRTTDILASVAAAEYRPFTVGFAAETGNLREYALGKLESKKLDLIVANLVGDGRGFDTEHNTVDVYWPDGERSFSERHKMDLAKDIIELIAERYEVSDHTATKPELPAIAIRD